ncbi:MAG: TlyA family RNA methyltransferase [Ruminococcus sp.]|nr:TlyA family RNA methyltransferase [Ruminococcus sp.]
MRGNARSRERAKEMIKSGAVTVNGLPVKKPSFEVSGDDILESSEKEKYVGRGALKLERAAEYFSLVFSGMICLDIGASTGGFTEYMLMQGAERVYAVDVGHGQLAEKLRSDIRVVNMENTDIRSISADDTSGQVDVISADVSFISLTKIIPKIIELLKPDGTAAVLIKPQFEAGKMDIGKGGVVRDRKAHIRVLTELDSFFRLCGLIPTGYTYSPVRGGSGNIEYLAELKKCVSETKIYDFRSLVDDAFRNL